MRISIKSLGCPKNFLDSELLCGHLLTNKHTITNQMPHSDIAIINTCSFIQPAVEESIDVILEAISLKEKGLLKYIIVAGCLPQRYQEQGINKSFPEVDAFIGVDQIEQINYIVTELRAKNPLFKINPAPHYLYTEHSPRMLLTPNHYGYLKISEGCNNHCSYCLIPQIKGHYRSRSIDSILNEVQQLEKNYPLKELILIAEDTTFFGKDREGQFLLPFLLNQLAQLPLRKIKWIRLMYTHPKHFTDRLSNTIAQNSYICPYLDIPLQHISNPILKKMNRGINQQETFHLINKLRKNIPHLTLRTTFIVGFPGETEKDFRELCDFVREYRFEKVGVFTYYDEPECRAYHFSDKIPDKIKKKRRDILMQIQHKNVQEYQQSQLGKIKQVLIDSVSRENDKVLLGRSCGEAPDIDGHIEVLKGNQYDIGQFINVRIKDAFPYHLIAEKV